MRIFSLIALTFFVGSASAQTLPRTADGRPDLQGIWQVANRTAYNLEDHVARHGMPASRSVVDGGTIPYQSWAAEQRQANFDKRATDDPLNNCFLPGTPRVMYMDWPFHIFQTDAHVAITFEWQQVYRFIYTNGQPSFYGGIESWMGDSRGRWEGDTLVVEVTDHNGQTWFDAAGNFHSSALRVTERYQMRDANTLDYEATIEDPDVFTRPWTLRMAFYRQNRHGSHSRVSVPSGEGGGERRFRARRQELVPGADPG